MVKLQNINKATDRYVPNGELIKAVKEGKDFRIGHQFTKKLK